MQSLLRLTEMCENIMPNTQRKIDYTREIYLINNPNKQVKFIYRLRDAETEYKNVCVISKSRREYICYFDDYGWSRSFRHRIKNLPLPNVSHEYAPSPCRT